MESFKEFKKSELKKAVDSEDLWYFDIDGNSELATANRSFFRNMKLDCNRLLSQFLDIDLKQLSIELLGIVLLLTLPLTFLPLLILRTYFEKKRADKALYERFLKLKNK